MIDKNVFPINGSGVLLGFTDKIIPSCVPIKLSTFEPVEGTKPFYDYTHLQPWLEQESEEVQKQLKENMTRTIGFLTDISLMPDGRYYGQAHFAEDTPLIRELYVLQYDPKTSTAYLTEDNIFEYAGFCVPAELFFKMGEETPSGRYYNKGSFKYTEEELAKKRFPVFTKLQEGCSEANFKQLTMINEKHYQFHIGDAEMLFPKEGDTTFKFEISLNNLGRKLLHWFQSPILLNSLSACNFVDGQVLNGYIIYLFLDKRNKFKPVPRPHPWLTDDVKAINHELHAKHGEVNLEWGHNWDGPIDQRKQE